ncbi:hypothetical protein LCGC14_1448970 [marine sediment metagenome]|uniref:Uncharacterized protein n=1 Tax=marine sediment metagenome TaxID=412755 RepID=A0A0F9K4M9_9ZZZZ
MEEPKNEKISNKEKICPKHKKPYIYSYNNIEKCKTCLDNIFSKIEQYISFLNIINYNHLSSIERIENFLHPVNLLLTKTICRLV